MLLWANKLRDFPEGRLLSAEEEVFLLSSVSIISRTGKRGLVVTVDVTAHERKSSTEHIEPTRYPSRSQEN